MRVVCAIDSFKGCLSSTEANQAARDGVLLAFPDAEIITVPVSDGGEGWLEAYQAAIGGTMIEVGTCDPLQRPLKASYLHADNLVVIEVAQVIGLSLLKPEERNPLIATTYGLGLLLADAIQRGCTDFIIGLGGSATSDAGTGMLEALATSFGVSVSALPSSHPSSLHFTIATDVRNPLCGPQGAAAIFAPQKGATPEMVTELEDRAERFAEQTALIMGVDHSQDAGAGAAGGLGYAFLQFLHADCKPGIDILLDAISFDHIAQKADCVITGEGRADEQTLMGKLPMGILRRTERLRIPTLLLAGQIAERQTLIDAGFADAVCINPHDLPLEIAMQTNVARQNIKKATAVAIQKLF